MTNRAISDENYELVLSGWKNFKMNTTNNYHDLHLKVDNILLAYVFDTFRRELVYSFELDSANYLSTTGYSWDAMLRFNDVNLKLTSDIEK